MNVYKLIILRLFCITFGRIPCCALLFKRILVYLLIKKAKEKYTAASRYFDYRDLKKEESRQ